MATQHVKINLLLNLYREGKTYLSFVSSCRLREIKVSGTYSLFPPFGDPWPSCLLPSYYHTIALISHVSKVMLKIRQTRLQQYMNWELLSWIWKRQRNQRSNCQYSLDIIEKAREFRKTSTSLSTLKSLTVWIITNCGKFLKKWEYQTTLPASWDPCM